VAIARALVTEPEAILCDEPTGNLDSANSKEILAILRGLPDMNRRAVVMVTHDPSAASIADRIIHIRDGRIENEEMVGSSWPEGRGARGPHRSLLADP
jgi:putative ABC transport system ATP-binding protein